MESDNIHADHVRLHQLALGYHVHSKFHVSVEDELAARDLIKHVDRNTSSLAKIVIQVFENEVRIIPNQPWLPEFGLCSGEALLAGIPYGKMTKFSSKSFKTCIQSPTTLKAPFGYTWSTDWKIMTGKSTDVHGFEYACKLSWIIEDKETSRRQNCDSPDMKFRRRKLVRTLIPNECAPLVTGSKLLNDMLQRNRSYSRFFNSTSHNTSHAPHSAHQHNIEQNSDKNSSVLNQYSLSKFIRPTWEHFYNAYIVLHVARGKYNAQFLQKTLQKTSIYLDIVYDNIIYDRIVSDRNKGNTNDWLQTVLIPCSNIPDVDASKLRLHVHKNFAFDDTGIISYIDIPIADILKSRVDDLESLLQSDMYMSSTDINDKYQRNLLTNSGKISNLMFNEYSSSDGIVEVTVGYQLRVKRLFYVNEISPESQNENAIHRSHMGRHGVQDFDLFHKTYSGEKERVGEIYNVKDLAAMTSEYVSSTNLPSSTPSSSANQEGGSGVPTSAARVTLSAQTGVFREAYKTAIDVIYDQTYSFFDVLDVYKSNYGLINSSDVEVKVHSHRSGTEETLTLPVNGDVFDILTDCCHVLKGEVMKSLIDDGIDAPLNVTLADPVKLADRLTYITNYLVKSDHMSKLVLPTSLFSFPDVIVNGQFISPLGDHNHHYRQSIVGDSAISLLHSRKNSSDANKIRESSLQDSSIDKLSAAIESFKAVRESIMFERVQQTCNIQQTRALSNKYVLDYEYSVSIFTSDGAIYLIRFDSEINYWDFLIAYGKLEISSPANCTSLGEDRYVRGKAMNELSGDVHVDFCDIEGFLKTFDSTDKRDETIKNDNAKSSKNGTNTTTTTIKNANANKPVGDRKQLNIFDSYPEKKSGTTQERHCGLAIIDPDAVDDGSNVIFISYFDILGVEISKSCSDFLDCQVIFSPNFVLGDFSCVKDGDFDQVVLELTNLHNREARHASRSFGSFVNLDDNKTLTFTPSSMTTFKDLKQLLRFGDHIGDSSQSSNENESCNDNDNDEKGCFFLTSFNIISSIKSEMIPNGFLCKLFSSKEVKDDPAFIGYSYIDIPPADISHSGMSISNIYSRIIPPSTPVRSLLKPTKDSNVALYSLRLTISSAANISVDTSTSPYVLIFLLDAHMDIIENQSQIGNTATKGGLSTTPTKVDHKSNRGYAYKTSISKTFNHPIWNETVEFHEKNSCVFRAFHVRVEVWNHNALKGDDCLGEVLLPIFHDKDGSETTVTAYSSELCYSSKMSSKLSDASLGILNYSLNWGFALEKASSFDVVVEPSSLHKNLAFSGQADKPSNSESILNGNLMLRRVDINRFIFPCALSLKSSTTKALAKETFYLDFTDNYILIFFDGELGPIASVLMECSECVTLPANHFHQRSENYLLYKHKQNHDLRHHDSGNLYDSSSGKDKQGSILNESANAKTSGKGNDQKQQKTSSAPTSPTNSNNDKGTSGGGGGGASGRGRNFVIAIPYNQLNADSIFSISSTIVSAEFQLHRKFTSGSGTKYQEISFRGLIGPCCSDLAVAIIEKCRTFTNRVALITTIAKIDELREQAEASRAAGISIPSNSDLWTKNFDEFIFEDLHSLCSSVLKIEKRVNHFRNICANFRDHFNIGYCQRELSITKKLLLRQKLYVAVAISKWINGYLAGCDMDDQATEANKFFKVLDLFQFDEQYNEINSAGLFFEKHGKVALAYNLDPNVDISDHMTTFTLDFHAHMWQLMFVNIVRCRSTPGQITPDLRNLMSLNLTKMIYGAYGRLVDYVSDLKSDKGIGDRLLSSTENQIKVMKFIIKNNDIFWTMSEIFLSLLGLQFTPHPSFALLASQRHPSHGPSKKEASSDIDEFGEKVPERGLYYPKLSDMISIDDLMRKFSILLSIEIQKWQKNSIIRISSSVFGKKGEIENKETDRTSLVGDMSDFHADDDEEEDDEEDGGEDGIVINNKDLKSSVDDVHGDDEDGHRPNLFIDTRDKVFGFAAKTLNATMTTMRAAIVLPKENLFDRKKRDNKNSAKDEAGVFNRFALWELDRVNVDSPEYKVKAGMIISPLPELIDMQLNVQLNAKLIASSESSMNVLKHLNVVKNINMNVVSAISGSYERFASEYCFVAIKFYDVIMRTISSTGHGGRGASGFRSIDSTDLGVFQTVAKVGKGIQRIFSSGNKDDANSVNTLLNAVEDIVAGASGVEEKGSDFDLKEAINGSDKGDAKNGVSDLFYDYVVSMINDLYRIKALNIPRSKQRVLMLLDYYDPDFGGLLINSGVINDLELHKLFVLSLNTMSSSITFLINLLIGSMIRFTLDNQVVEFDSLWKRHAETEYAKSNGQGDSSPAKDGLSKEVVSPLVEICCTMEDFLEFACDVCAESEKIQIINIALKKMYNRYLLFLRDLVQRKEHIKKILGKSKSLSLSPSSSAFPFQGRPMQGSKESNFDALEPFEMWRIKEDANYVETFVEGLITKLLLHSSSSHPIENTPRGPSAAKGQTSGAAAAANKMQSLKSLFLVDRFTKYLYRLISFSDPQDFIDRLTDSIFEFNHREFPVHDGNIKDYRTSIYSFIGMSQDLNQEYREISKDLLNRTSQKCSIELSEFSCINLNSSNCNLQIRVKIDNVVKSTYVYSKDNKSIERNQFYNVVDWSDVLQFEVSKLEDQSIEIEIVGVPIFLGSKETVLGVVVISLYGYKASEVSKKNKATSMSDIVFTSDDLSYNCRGDLESGVSAWFKVEDYESFKNWDGAFKSQADDHNTSTSSSPSSAKPTKLPDGSKQANLSALAPSGGAKKDKRSRGNGDRKLTAEPLFLSAQQEFALRSLYSRSTLGPRAGVVDGLGGEVDVPQLHVRFTVTAM